MSRFLSRFLLALAALALVVGACSSSDDDDDAPEDDNTEDVETTDEDTTDDGEDTTDDGDDEPTDDGGSDEDALAALEDGGFTGEAGECVLDSLKDQGIDVSDLSSSDVATPSAELSEAFAQAGADCVDVIADGGLDVPAGATDLSDPAIYDAFVDGFVSTSGLPRATAECIADYMLENDIDPLDAIGGDGSEIQGAFAACQ